MVRAETRLLVRIPFFLLPSRHLQSVITSFVLGLVTESLYTRRFPQVLTKRLTQLNEALARKVASRNEYDKVIAETEAAYMKILESSQTLLTVLKREAVNMNKNKQASS